MIEIIPAIDLIGGKCVRLTQGDYDRRTTYADDPLEVARGYEAIGVRRLHLVDLDGAKASRPVNLPVLERIAKNTSLSVQWGGGIKDETALDTVFAVGATRAICGSVAVTHPELLNGWFEKFGPERIVLGADLKDGKVATHGWLEDSGLTIEALIDRFLPYGLCRVVCTDISKDGMLEGPSFDLYTRLQARYPTVGIIVSGGISSADDILKLNDLGLRSVIVGKAIYEGRITLEKLKALVRQPI
ncbi:MAG: 1-(5-phosphoribosyl)-5-[(5-phosphoribosylamino)methylideneamino]imidazole-4-carboxamide isomerase [Rikenellaceae bacterium]|jgi:phosphoribosylformimino-5-aminoimidazole carboxamide ribotide isomerase|nr:1-(5-phosphoribosyl)-5-[(5-phosphoribosylamino)methylideneamino]imidazole-4-carboxamide isomerase [Rikenellaceae bacterium]